MDAKMNIVATSEAPRIALNEPELRAWAEGIAGKYAGLVVTEEQVPAIRKDMAERMGRPASRLQPWNQLFLYCLTLEMWMTGMKDICASARAGHAGAPAVLDASPVRQEPAQKAATP